ncbi:MAG TPA: DNA methyltransferase, partial [Ktedonobacteraceae bacterium]
TPERYIQPTLYSPARQLSETSAEYTIRRTRYQELYALLSSGSICSIDDCITYNLDMVTFAQDALLHLTSPELLLKFYQSLQQVRILDPTCGSGAFLFAALTLLVPLYETCFTRMQTLLTQHPTSPIAFHEIFAQAATSPNLRSFVLHTILTHNLYGVDLMPEAIELCKLRFSLLLLAEENTSASLAPLPSLAHHLCTGNALVGFVSTSHPTQINSPDALDHLLAEKYGIAPDDTSTFARWRAQHQPFHWSTMFPEVMAQGGFSVILGNPPYVEYDTRTFSYTLRDFQTLSCANLYPCVIERSYHLLSRHGRIGMILPLAAFATRNMLPFLNSARSWFPGSWLSFYHFRPSMLFSGSKIASIPTLILLGRPNGPEQRFSTHLLKWCKEQRSQLFSSLSYCAITAPRDSSNPHYYPKFGQSGENEIMEKVLRHPCIRRYLAPSPNHNSLSYRSAGGLYWKVFLNFPWPYHTTSNKQCFFQLPYDRDVFVALLNSSLFWWYYTVTFDSFNLKDYMLFGFRFSYPDDPAAIAMLKTLCHQLMADFCLHARHLKRGETDSYTLYAKKSKPLLDEIDCVLAQLYGFTHEEYEFIISYDLKYRLGVSSYD